MTMHRLVMGTILGLMLTVATGWANDKSHGKQIRVKGSCAGSFTPSEFDSNNDGQKGDVDLTTLTSNLGPSTSQCLSELLPPLPTPVTCPPGTAEFPLLASNCVSTDPNTLDQLAVIYSSGSKSWISPQARSLPKSKATLSVARDGTQGRPALFKTK